MGRIKWHSHRCKSRDQVELTLKEFKTPLFSSDERKKPEFCGTKAWGFGRKREKSEFEEEYLLRLAKCRSGINPNDQSDFPRSSSDRDVHRKHTRKVGTQKYIRESCYHNIECFVANSLAALMGK